MAIKTLLLCFIHGFKGDEETFYQFPEDLKTSLSTSNPTLTIQTRVYPKYETRGDLALSAETFKEWLQSQIISLENASSNTSAIHSPSVSVILVAHSMGGFVAADTLFSILDNRPVSNDPGLKLMFPLVQGVLAFDTPWNGLSRSMFGYGAFSQYQNISSAWNLLSTGTSFLTAAGARNALSATASSSAQNAARSQIAARGAASNNSWMRWSALAARTGTYGAIMAGGVAAYIHRDQILQSLKGINRESLAKINYANTKDAITSINYSDSISQGLTYVSRESIGEGFAWMASHLKFVGALMKTHQLTARLERLSEIEGVGIKCLYTSLGENGVWSGGYFVPKRTFCAIPTASGKDEKERAKGEKMKELFVECPDVKAGNEIVAHCGMFRKDRNDNYENMLKLSTGLVDEWLKVDPRRVRDEWRPSGEQLQRTMSESEVWDDDGKVLKPPGGDGDEGQLDAILKSDEMPHGEDGGVDEKELMERATSVPLPVDEDVIGEGVLGEKIMEAESAVRAAEADGSAQTSAADQHVEKNGPNEMLVEEKSSEEQQSPVVEDQKPLKAEDSNLAEELGKTTLDDKPQVEKETPTEESKQEPADSAAKKSWLGMIPGVSSLSAKSSESEVKTQEETKSEQNAAPQKTWLGMLPSVSSLSTKSQETTQKNEGETKVEGENAAEQPAGESRKKWFGVV